MKSHSRLHLHNQLDVRPSNVCVDIKQNNIWRNCTVNNAFRCDLSRSCTCARMLYKKRWCAHVSNTASIVRYVCVRACSHVAVDEMRAHCLKQWKPRSSRPKSAIARTLCLLVQLAAVYCFIHKHQNCKKARSFWNTYNYSWVAGIVKAKHKSDAPGSNCIVPLDNAWMATATSSMVKSPE